MSNFSAIPILDYTLVSDPATTPEFIDQLRHAVINVGFFYLRGAPVAPQDVADVIAYIPRLFALPQEAKDAISMANSPHFLGYSRLGTERTKGLTDNREQFDFATPTTCRWRAGDPDHLRLWGPAQWPAEDALPGFRATLERYFAQVRDLSFAVMRLLAQALGLPPDAMDRFYDAPEQMQHRGKVVRYPGRTGPGAADQGVGPHFDSGFLTFLLQASPHAGLQVQNMSGQWIDAPPIDGTFVVNIGKALEFVTQGLARATSHRVLSPEGPAPRFSVPLFQNIGLNKVLADHVLQFPPEILKLRDARGDVAAPDSVNYGEYGTEPSGRVMLLGRVRSHPTTAARHYPTLFAQVFPDGLPEQGSAY